MRFAAYLLAFSLFASLTVGLVPEANARGFRVRLPRGGCSGSTYVPPRIPKPPPKIDFDSFSGEWRNSFGRHGSQFSRLETQGLLEQLKSIQREAALSQSAREAAVTSESAASRSVSASAKKEVSTYVSMPRSQGSYWKVFREDLTKKTHAELQKVQARLQASALRVHLAGEGNGGLQEFRRFVANSQSDTIVVIGHNRSGQFFFPDGGKAPLRELVQTARIHNKHVVLLSCNSYEYLASKGSIGSWSGVKSEISFLEASRIAERLQARLAGIRSSRPVNSSSIQDVVHSLARQERLRSTVEESAKGFAFATILVGAPSLLDDEDHRPEDTSSDPVAVPGK